mmetsp:Transcript_12095/g.22195  ORF Transcript_12095/g.22195 Transcript_12095/m.22195 type:complete len:383 (-) Transcript_12095:207-1355(-)
MVRSSTVTCASCTKHVAACLLVSLLLCAGIRVWQYSKLGRLTWLALAPVAPPAQPASGPLRAKFRPLHGQQPHNISRIRAFDESEDVAMSHVAGWGDMHLAGRLAHAGKVWEPWQRWGNTISGPVGVVLWAYGRSGTTLFMQTMKNSVSPTMHFCNHRKEPFEVLPLTRQTLLRCIKKRENLFHMKPHQMYFQTSTLRSPASFFKACAWAGFVVLVTVHRENLLAHALSQIDLNCRHEHTDAEARIECAHNMSSYKFCRPDKNMLVMWKNERYKFDRGIGVARQQGMHVLNFTFAQVNRDACSAVKEVTKVMTESSNKEYTSPECAPRGDAYHKAASLHELSTLSRMGQTAYACFVKRIEESEEPSKYRWMLDLSMEAPPSL